MSLVISSAVIVNNGKNKCHSIKMFNIEDTENVYV